MEPLEHHSIESTASLLAGAFEANPAYAYLFPRARDRHRALAHFFASTLTLHLPHRCSYVRREPSSGRIVATATFIPPAGISIPLATMLRTGLPRFAWEQGLLGMRRLDRLRAEIAALDELASDARPHWYLTMMAVHPDHQGAGHGTALASRCIERLVDRGDGDTDCTLNTQREQNLVFYRRLGFELTTERILGDTLGGSGFRTWAMTRRSRAQHARSADSETG